MTPISTDEPLIPKHGGYRKLKSFRVAQLVSLLNVGCYLLDRQLAALAQAFETEGGFTERLYRIRSQRRRS